MNLTMSFVFAALLVLIGAPQPSLNNNADTIVACAEDAGILAFAEAKGEISGIVQQTKP